MRFRQLILLFFSTFAFAFAQLPDPSTVDLSDVSEKEAAEMKAHAARLHGSSEQELVKSILESSAAQKDLAQEKKERKELDERIKAREKYDDALEASVVEAKKAVIKETKRADKAEADAKRIRVFAHWMLMGIWGVCFSIVWHVFGMFTGPAGLTPPLLWWRVGACVVAASGGTYVVFHFLSRT